LNCKFLDSYRADVNGRSIDVFHCRKREPFVLGDTLDVALKTCSSCRLSDLTRPPTELVQEVERRNQELVALAAIVSAVNASLELEHVLNTGLDEVMQTLQVEAGWVTVARDERIALETCRGLSQQFVAEIALLSGSTGLGGLVTRQVEATVIDELEAPLEREMRREGLVGLLAVPLRAQGRLLGALFLGSRDARAYSADDMYFANTAGAQIALAVEHAILYAEQLARMDREQRLLKAAEQLNLKLESSLSVTIIAEARRLMDADKSALLTIERDTLVAWEALNLSDDYRRLAALPLGDSLSGNAVMQGITIAVDDVAEEPSSDAALAAAGQYRAFIVSPLQIHDRKYGAITVFYELPRQFTEDDKRLLRTFANHAAIALDNQRLMREKDAMAVRDGLTGVFNRTYLELALERVMTEVRRNGGQVSLLFIDIDGMKAVNDHYGHQSGDRLLKEMAALISRCCRETDVVARYGGDEFVVLMPNTDEAGALQVDRKIDEAMDRLNRVGASRYRVSASRGIHTSGWTDAEQLLHEADKRMYEMKRGREVPA
jgi:diguanylate cyclase (GGDEF)-like protein